MFDPTAFDNMKVVIEGALYDLDISGEIVITDRNDFINLAKMSRKFDVSFQLPNQAVTAKIELTAGLVNLAAELLAPVLSEQEAGCQLRLQFLTAHENMDIDYRVVEGILRNIWGPTRTITQSVHYDPLRNETNNAYIITIEFDRLIREDQMDDLVEMTEFIITTLEDLSKKIS